jgi:hypothetical protein
MYNPFSAMSSGTASSGEREEDEEIQTGGELL